jgi:hypothetical protein
MPAAFELIGGRTQGGGIEDRDMIARPQTEGDIADHRFSPAAAVQIPIGEQYPQWPLIRSFSHRAGFSS